MADNGEMIGNIYREVWQTFQNNALVDANVPQADLATLQEACGSDLSKFRRYLKRRIFGERVPYIVGYQDFCSLRFTVDRRVYIPDWDGVFLVDTVTELAERKFATEGRPITLLEAGVGSGCLAITLKSRLGEKVRVIGVDIDTAALDVARENVKRHGVEVELIESDLFEAVPADVVPSIVYSNPPWGNEDPTHYGERSLSYFLEMPRIASFAVDGVTELHESIIGGDRQRGWGADILLYNGVMDRDNLERLKTLTPWSDVLWFDNETYSLLHCRN